MTLTMERPPAERSLGRTLLLLLSLIFLLGFIFLAVLQYLSGDQGLIADEQQVALLAKARIESPARKSAEHDWPQWRGPRRDGISAETGLNLNWPGSGPKLLWQQAAGPGYSSFAISQGRCFTQFQEGDQETVVCWDAETGKEFWRFRYPALYQNSFGDGPRSTPTVDGDLVFTVGGTGLLHCLKTATGEKVWSKDLLADFGAKNLTWGVSFSPLVVDELLFINPGGPGGNSIAALEKRTGTLRYKALDDQAGYSSPILADIAGTRQVVFFLEKGLAGVVPETGEVLWRFPWETSQGCNIATPIIAGDYVFLSSGYGKGCALVRVEKADDGWKTHRVYKSPHMSNHISSSVLWNDHLYGFNDAFLTCMDFRTGKVRWKERGYDKGCLFLVEDHLVILSEKGVLAVVEATPERFREKCQFRFSEEDNTWTVPVLANGRLYVRDRSKAACYDLRR